MKQEVRNMIEQLRDESLIDFCRASDRERVVDKITVFIEKKIKEKKRK